MTSQRPKPNLFKYGRKELSQDAMICWLLSWADERYAKACPALHEAGQNFAKALFGKHGSTGPSEGICTVKLEQQASGIDVLAWINGKYALLIEDKTDSREHSDQLGRYHEAVLGGRACVEGKCITPSKDRFFPIFLKTGNMSRADKAGVEARELEPRYKVFERGDFLGVLEKCGRCKSEIMDDFSDYLQELEKDTESWKETPLEKWSWRAWEGFYRCLEERIDPGSKKNMNWGYVSNPAGGFLALYWEPGGDVYLQAEQEKLCFKIWVEDSDQRSERRQHWHEQIVHAGESLGLPIKKPARFGSGTSMTVAILEGDWRQSGSDGRLDLEKTVEELKKAERVLQAAVSKGSHG